MLNRDGSSINAVTETKQEINPSVLGEISDYFGKPGADVLHELTESYQGALISRILGIDAGIATQAENDNLNGQLIPFYFYMDEFFSYPENGENVLRKLGTEEGIRKVIINRENAFQINFNSSGEIIK